MEPGAPCAPALMDTGLSKAAAPAQQPDIMLLMLPNTEELLLEQSIFNSLSACTLQ